MTRSFEGSLARFRPIMMTTMAPFSERCRSRSVMVAGSESRRPLGLAVVGGLDRFANAHSVSDSGCVPLLRIGAEAFSGMEAEAQTKSES